MFKNGKEWEWTTNQVEFFGLTALVIYFVSLLCFEWNCFSFSLACFLLIFVRSWFLWNFVNYSRSSWRHYERRKKKCPCLLLDPCVSFPALGLKTVSARSLSESAQWVFELKKTKQTNGKTAGRGGKQSADPPAVSLDLRGNESTKHLHAVRLPPAPVNCTCQIFIRPWQKERISPLRLSLTHRSIISVTCIGRTALYDHLNPRQTTT